MEYKNTLKKRIKKQLELFKSFCRKPSYTNKVFCVGFNKTGTTTIGKSLEMLGYRNLSFNSKIYSHFKKGEFDTIFDYASKYDSFDDLPWLDQTFIPIIDKKFPNSKFIYLNRDENSWRKSVTEWTELRTGVSSGDNVYLSFKAHQKFVLNYFKDRDDLLILEIDDKLGFKKLADFLNAKSIQNEFPHFNNTKEFKKNLA